MTKEETNEMLSFIETKVRNELEINVKYANKYKNLKEAVDMAFKELQVLKQWKI